MKKENLLKYGNAILSMAIVTLLGSIFTNKGLDWLSGLDKPSEWLTDFIIPIVWSVIYSLFTIFLIYLLNKNKLKKEVTILLLLNGFLNVLWCLVYFTLKNILLGQIIIIINLVSSILLIIQIFKIKKIWGYILLVYPSWLSIATCLNLAIWILN